MRGVGQKAAVLFERLTQADDHAIERQRQVLQFISCIGQRQPLVQVMQGDLFGASRNLHHRRQRAAHQKKAAAHRHQAEQGHAEQKREKQMRQDRLNRRHRPATFDEEPMTVTGLKNFDGDQQEVSVVEHAPLRRSRHGRR